MKQTVMSRAFSMLLVALLAITTLPLGIIDAAANAQDIPQAKGYSAQTALSQAANRYGRHMTFTGNWQAKSDVTRTYGTTTAAMANSVYPTQQSVMEATVTLTEASHIHFDYIALTAGNQCTFEFGYTKDAGSYVSVLNITNTDMSAWASSATQLKAGTYIFKWTYTPATDCTDSDAHYAYVDDVYVGTGSTDLGSFAAGAEIPATEAFTAQTTNSAFEIQRGSLPFGAEITSVASDPIMTWSLNAFTCTVPGTYEFTVNFADKTVKSFIITIVETEDYMPRALFSLCTGIKTNASIYRDGDLTKLDLIAGSIPGGLELAVNEERGNGTISGTPTKAGVFSFVLVYNDAYAEALTLTVDGADREVTLQSGKQNMDYTAEINSVLNGSYHADLALYGYMVFGLSLSTVYDAANNAAYTLAGRPTSEGTFSFAIAYTYMDDGELAEIVLYHLTVTKENSVEIGTVSINAADIAPASDDVAGDHMASEIPEGAHYTIEFMSWYNATDSMFMNDDDTFVTGKVYSRCWELRANAGYKFIDNTIATVNDEVNLVSADSHIHESDNTLFILWTTGFEAEMISVTQIEIVDAVVNPVSGNTTAQSINFDIPADANYICTEYNWYCDTDGTEMQGTDVFVAGKMYSRRWCLQTTGNFKFVPDVTATINGSSAIVDAANSYMSADRTTYYLWLQSTEATGEGESIILTNVEIINADITVAVGDTPADHMGGTVPGGAGYSVTKHVWYDNTESRELSSGEQFKSGNRYSAIWYVDANEGYAFANDLTFSINGSTTLVDTSRVTITESACMLGTIPTEATEPPTNTEITDVVITDADVTATVGETAGDSLSYTLPENAAYTTAAHYWCSTTNAAQLSDSDVFSSDETYALYWVFSAANGYEFTTHTIISVNGSTTAYDIENTVLSSDGKTLTVRTVPAAAEEGAGLLGDVTGDGRLNTGDAVMVLRQNAGLITFTPEQEALADYTKDGRINTGDAVAILRFAAGLNIKKEF